MESRYNYYLGGNCVHEETEEEGYFSVPFSFENEELFHMWNDMSFDDMGDDFNEWLWENGHEGWVLDDILEAEREIAGVDENIKSYVWVDE